MTPGPIRAVLDTNVLISALLFDQGLLGWVRPCWQSGRLAPVLAQPTLRELLRVLAYPKFCLDPSDRERLLEDLLPWCESWTAPSERTLQAASTTLSSTSSSACRPRAGEGAVSSPSGKELLRPRRQGVLMELHLPQLDGHQGPKGIVCRRIVQHSDLIAQRNRRFHLI